MVAEILQIKNTKPLVLADTEHYVVKLLEYVRSHLPFDLLVPMHKRKGFLKEMATLPDEVFTRHWIGYATMGRPYNVKNFKGDPFWQTVQRLGERQNKYGFNAFLCTSEHVSVDAPLQHYPKRWHCEEFFNANQALGWRRAGTLNLHIRYGQITMALIAQTVIAMLRKRVGDPVAGWDAKHLADEFFHGLDGDIRVNNDRILITYYNAPNSELLRKQYTNLPEILQKEGVDPRIPWLYNYKLDFSFK
ncbi:MAG: hypothetical protein A2161_17025 [Candidatus Schekmanbacteria bacterium RBG_13_48_7]|uniref:Uncharacterized protein n=1 Tax=Candidatus Schekmanbacteria bacterium RBG_13_48_7 TaxID=1817878 RepID=A0A1F7S5J2_9BACT|nr:MAG: hypothetical protein A2161_17025 [Candidatus Schekmanbacteria bacterium RBG_13_48_7]